MRTVIVALAAVVTVSLCLAQPMRRPMTTATATASGPMSMPARMKFMESQYIEQFSSSTASERMEALRKLGTIHAESPEALAALKKGLADSSPDVQAAAAGALAEIGTGDALLRLKGAADTNQNAKKVYDAALAKLRTSAASGDAQAKDILEKLGETTTMPSKTY